MELEKKGTNATFLEWLTTHVPAIRDDHGLELRQVGDYGNVPLQSVAGALNNQKLQHLGPLFMFHADATSRLTAGNSVSNINFLKRRNLTPLAKGISQFGTRNEGAGRVVGGFRSGALD